MGQGRQNMPSPKTRAHEISELLHKHGEVSVKQLVEMTGMRKDKLIDVIASWMSKAWFIAVAPDTFALSTSARRYLDGCEVDEEEQRKIATGPAINMMQRPAYVAPKPFRRTGPDFAQRPEGFGFITFSNNEGK